MQPIPALDNKARKMFQDARVAIHDSRNYIGFMVIDHNGRITLCSNRMAGIWGCDPAVLEGVKLDALLFDYNDRGITTGYFGRNKANFGYKFGWHRLHVITKDGRRIPLEGSIVTFHIGEASMTLLHLRHQDAV